jgi:hypothetical protein
MKKMSLKYLTVLLAVASINGCSKKEEAPAPNTTQQKELNYQDYAKISSAFSSLTNDIQNVQKESSSSNNGSNKRVDTDCANYTWFSDTKGKPVAGFGESYIKVTMAFNGACSDGVSRSGTVELYFGGWGDTWKDSLAVKNLVVNGLTINGFRTSKNSSNYQSPNTAANNVRIVGDVKLPDGQSYRYTSAELNLWTGWDKVVKTGTGTLKDNQFGTTFDFNIATPLLHTLDCSWFKYPLSGVLEFTTTLAPGKKASINYGNGSCDQDAVYTDSAGNQTPFKQQ